MLNKFYSGSARVASILAVAILSGCAQPPESLYYWGEYQPMIYDHFTQEKGPEEQIKTLEADVEKAHAANKPLPPGQRAHLGLLYGTAGRADRMRDQLVEEKLHFPESATYMDSLLKNFEK